MTKSATNARLAGNISSANPKKDPQGKRWFITVNNWSETEYATISEYVTSRNLQYILAKEIGEKKGVPHLHWYFESKVNLRFSSLKKLLPRADIERARGKRENAIEYCKKCNDFKTNFKLNLKERLLQKYYSEVQWRPWQQKIVNILSTKTDPRCIHWIYDPVGNNGKSFLCKFIALKYDALTISGKKSDMAHAIAKRLERNPEDGPDIVMVDVPRREGDYINYGCLESIKNGHVFSGKYEGCELLFDHPKIFVFANILPEEDAWTSGRCKIIPVLAPASS